MQQCWYSLLFLDLLSSVVGVGDQTISCFSIRKDHCYRRRSALNAAHPIVTDNYEHTINTSQHQLVKYPSPSRCTSHDAALLIQNQNCSAYDDNSLLIITCDASGRGGELLLALHSCASTTTNHNIHHFTFYSFYTTN